MAFLNAQLLCNNLTSSQTLGYPKVNRFSDVVHKDLEILILDKNSPDGTVEICDQIACHNTREKVLHWQNKNGLNPAFVAKFGCGLKRGYTCIVEMDADMGHYSSDLV